MKNTIVWASDTTGKSSTICFPITVEELAAGHFRVTYGAQVSNDLTYSEACKQLGSAILHASAYEGRMKD